MSGIAGCLALAEDAAPDADWVSRATRRLAHRGPDDDGIHSDGGMALGVRRLVTAGLPAAGHQPLRSADGRYWMVWNGEIYNAAEVQIPPAVAAPSGCSHFCSPSQACCSSG